MRIHDLGRLEVEVEDGGPSTVIGGAKQIALLSILCAMRGQRVSLQALREAGWAGQARVADATIENHVWRMRKVIEPGVPAASSQLTYEDEGYRLDLDPRTVDSSLFESIARDARDAAQRSDYAATLQLCDRALILWRGEPFGASAHVPAVASAIDHLVEIHAQVEERRIDALLALGETQRATVDARRLTGLHPFREHLWAQQMTALARQGRNSEALALYQEVRSLLRDELGLDPGRELQDLQRAIILHELSASSRPVVDPIERLPEFALTPTPLWPLIGRRRESAAVADAVQREMSLVIEGSAGAGKTRMLDEVIRTSRDAGADVVRVIGTRSGAGVPLGVFADFLPISARSDDVLTLLQRCTEALRRTAAGRRLVITVDDAHLLDSASAALLLHLATAGGFEVALTVRTREPMPDAIRALQRLQETTVVQIRALDADDTARLFDAVLGGPADPLLHSWAYRTTLGNPFHVVELARAARRDESIRFEKDHWVSEGTPRMPASLGELVQSALERLDPASRDLVERLAFTEPVRVSDLDSDAGRLATALEQEGLIVVQGSGRDLRIALAHPLLAAVLRETLPPLRAHQIRKELVARFSTRTSLTPDERLRLARWKMDVGDLTNLGEAVDYARLAVASNDPSLALELLGCVRAAAGTADAELTDTDVDARLLRARAHILRAEHAAAAAALQGVEPALRTSEQALAYVEAQIQVTRFGRAMLDDLPALFTRASRWWPDDDAWQHQLERLRLRDAVFEGQTGVADLDAPDGATDSTRLGSLYYSGRTAEALALYFDIEKPPPLLTLDDVTNAAIGVRVQLDRADNLPDLESRLLAMRRVGYDVDDPAAIGIGASKLADLRMLQGEPAAALELYEEAARHWERRDPLALRSSAWAGVVGAASQLGDLEASGRALVRVRSIAGETPRAHLIPYVARAQAQHAVDGGDFAAAAAFLDDAVQRLGASPVHVARLHYERVLLGLPVDQQHAVAVRAAAEASDSPLMALFALHAAALVQQDSAALAAVADQFRGLGVLAYAARADADARGVG